MTDHWSTYTRLQHMSSGDAAMFLPGDLLYAPRLDTFAKITGRENECTLTVRQSWAIHFYGRLMQVVSAFQCAWRGWRRDCI